MRKKSNIPILEIIASVGIAVIAITVVVMLFPSMKSQDTAALIQAFGSIAAILAAIAVVHFQNQNAIALQETQLKQSKIMLTEALATIVEGSINFIQLQVNQLSTRQGIYEICQGKMHLDIAGLQQTESWISAIQPHTLPSQILVRQVIILGATVRQFRENVELTLKIYKNMDGKAYDTFFKVIAEINSAMQKIRDNINIELDSLRQPLR